MIPVHDELGKRMKTYYEQIPQSKLMRRCPVCIRIDGKAFHSYTRGFQKPFDSNLVKTMQDTMKYLCENIQGCVCAYQQSDEITLILVDYKKLDSSAWFDYEVQKICSIAASMATMAFNKYFSDNVENLCFNTKEFMSNEEFDKMFDIYESKVGKAMFDARCFNIPKEEVTNLIYWRQLDATRNSIQMVGRSKFSHKQLDNKSCSDIQNMLMNEYQINWNDIPTYLKRGSCCIKDTTEDGRGNWKIDLDIPIFKGEGREYIDKLVYVESV